MRWRLAKVCCPRMRMSVLLSRRGSRFRPTSPPRSWAAGEVVAGGGDHEFAIHGRGNRDEHDGRDDRLEDAPFRNAGGLQGGHFVEALERGDGEHGGDEREDAAGAVEERQGAVAVEFPHDCKEAAVITGIANELLELAEGIDHHVQAEQAAKADQKNLDELAQEVAIENQHAGE